jgi:predicted deacetylase
MDDIAPEMNWNSFWKYIDMFRSIQVKPLLGVIPDNKDQKLMIDKPNRNFWSIMRKLQQDNIVDIAQHGYDHVYISESSGMMDERIGFEKKSEFAGLSYRVQYRKIKSGLNILLENGLKTDIWMAPGHTFDEKTLIILYELGFKYVTDGIGLFPFKKKNLLFVPQQFWFPTKIPFGIGTVCIHSNNENEQLFESIYSFIRAERKNVISFYEATNVTCTFMKEIMNRLFIEYHILARKKAAM